MPAVIYGSYDLILPEHEQIYAFTRTLANERLLVALNFSPAPAEFALPPEIAYIHCERLIGNYPAGKDDDARRFTLKPYEARVYRLR